MAEINFFHGLSPVVLTNIQANSFPGYPIHSSGGQHWIDSPLGERGLFEHKEVFLPGFGEDNNVIKVNLGVI